MKHRNDTEDAAHLSPEAIEYLVDLRRMTHDEFQRHREKIEGPARLLPRQKRHA